MAIRAKSRRVEDAFELFQLEKRGDRVSPATLDFYERQVGKCLRWLDRECPEALRFDGLDGTVLRRYRADQAGSLTRHGKPLQAESLRTSHRGVMAFLRWAADAGFAVDEELLRLRPPRREHKEATVYHVNQVRQILAKCENRTEELAVKILVGSGVSITELCGLALRGPDGVPDLMLDSLDRGRAELRVRSDGGAKGAKSRRVPITPRLAAAMKRYAALDRPESDSPAVLLNRRGQPFLKGGIDAMMDRFKVRVGFRRPRWPAWRPSPAGRRRGWAGAPGWPAACRPARWRRPSLRRRPGVRGPTSRGAARPPASPASTSGVECVEAAPGTGKTTALGVYLAACRRAGIEVTGCAPSARARDELRLGARIDRCLTVDRLLLDLERSSLAADSVVILDEASMAGSRKLARLLERAAAAGAKVVLVGDTKQLSSQWTRAAASAA